MWAFQSCSTATWDKTGQGTNDIQYVCVFLQGQFENLGVINNTKRKYKKKNKSYLPSWSWKSPSPDCLQCSVEQPAECPALTGERRTRLKEAWTRMRHSEVQRSGFWWLDRFQSQMDIPRLVGYFSLHPYWAQCGWVMATPLGYLEFPVQQIFGPHFNNIVVLYQRCEFRDITELDLDYKHN